MVREESHYCCRVYLSSCHRSVLHVNYWTIGNFHFRTTSCLEEPGPVKEFHFQWSNVSEHFFAFLSTEFAACSKAQNRDNHHKAFCPRTQQRNQGTGWPWPYDQGRRKNDDFTLSAMQPFLIPFNEMKIIAIASNHLHFIAFVKSLEVTIDELACRSNFDFTTPAQETKRWCFIRGGIVKLPTQRVASGDQWLPISGGSLCGMGCQLFEWCKNPHFSFRVPSPVGVLF